jgi:hypothetical protein
MRSLTGKSGKNTGKRRKIRQSSDEQIALHLCYRQIGISAVAAAARYHSGANAPAQWLTSAALDQRMAAIGESTVALS